jgi:hypothetical protein
MKRFLTVAAVAVVALAACKKKADNTPAADSGAMMNNMPADTMAAHDSAMRADSMKRDSTMMRDTTKHM